MNSLNIAVQRLIWLVISLKREREREKISAM